MKVLVILQGPAYGTEASYNGLHLAGNLATRDGVDVRIFRFGDAVRRVFSRRPPDARCPTVRLDARGT